MPKPLVKTEIPPLTTVRDHEDYKAGKFGDPNPYNILYGIFGVKNDAADKTYSRVVYMEANYVNAHICCGALRWSGACVRVFAGNGYSRSIGRNPRDMATWNTLNDKPNSIPCLNDIVTSEDVSQWNSEALVKWGSATLACGVTGVHQANHRPTGMAIDRVGGNMSEIFKYLPWIDFSYYHMRHPAYRWYEDNYKPRYGAYGLPISKGTSGNRLVNMTLCPVADKATDAPIIGSMTRRPWTGHTFVKVPETQAAAILALYDTAAYKKFTPVRASASYA